MYIYNKASGCVHQTDAHSKPGHGDFFRIYWNRRISYTEAFSIITAYR